MNTLSNIWVFSFIVTSISSLPIKNEVDTPYIVFSDGIQDIVDISNLANDDKIAVANTNNVLNITNNKNITNKTSFQRNQIRPGMVVTSYTIEITPDINGGTFEGRLTAQVNVIDQDTRQDNIVFHVRDLNIQSVLFSFAGGSTFREADFVVNNFEELLIINTNFDATLYTFVIEYSGLLDSIGHGIYIGNYDDTNYIGMNLHPTNARRVFPCVDEPTELSTITFTFEDMEYNHIISNSMLEDNSQSQFRPMQGPAHVWGMMAHNLNQINIPIANVLLYARPGMNNQDAQASVAINFFFTHLNEWTEKEYTEIAVNQDGRMHIFAVPDIARDWYALSTVCIWEPFVLMGQIHSVRQKTTALATIAEAMSRQWFGYVLFPENWRHQWVITGLASYAAYEILKEFQDDPEGIDVSLIDVNDIFVSEVIQESLLRDAYASAVRMEVEDDIFNANQIRDASNGLIKYKAPSIMRSLRLLLGDESEDFIQSAAKALFNTRSLQPVNSLNFYDAINSDWLFEGNEIIENVAWYLETYIGNKGYPLLHVGIRQGGIFLTQEHFSFTEQPNVNFHIPITYTIQGNPDFNNIHPLEVMNAPTTLNLHLDENEWVLFNLQGQGYYRVNYEGGLWDRIIHALNEPGEREEIHRLNRATLIDDSLNLARASKLDYDVALRVVLAMEHETEYAVWKAFVRNMDFLRKHLMALNFDLEQLDEDIYVRMIRRTIITFEEEIGFHPDPQINEAAMVSLTRGLVMDHACRSNYEPCIAAAIDWFYDPDNIEEVNPNIPYDIRPAVYCTMVREGEEDIIEMLEARLEEEPTQYERVVILEAMACSQDGNFIRELLENTIANDSPFAAEEKSKIFAAVAKSSLGNVNAAISFIAGNTQAIRDMYGGPEKLEEIIHILGDNIVDPFQLDQFKIWVNSNRNFLEDSLPFAERVRDKIETDMEWRAAYLENVYEWINENDASTMIVSSLLIFISFCVTLLNR